MYDFFRSALFNMDPERAHRLTTVAARAAHWTRVDAFLEDQYAYEDMRLRTRVWGLSFDNPVGLAAGFDKNAALVPFWPTLGFGFVEVGSVTARRSRGNPRPRAFRLPEDEAVINRMGLNNIGASRVARRLRRHTARTEIPVGVNIAKTNDPKILGDDAVEDFCDSFRLLAPVADYVALNISCPNTKDGRTFEDADALDGLLTAIMQEKKDAQLTVPVLVKLSPPLSDRIVYDSRIEEIVDVSLRHRVDGFIASNTATDRQGLVTDERKLDRIGQGGVSGRPLESRSTHLVRYLYRVTAGKVPIIGVGGIFTAEDAFRKIKAGASLVQIYTALVYSGPGLVRQLKTGIIELMEREGYSYVHKAVGVEA